MKGNLITKTLILKGMSCINCENKIKNTLKNIKGIVDAKVSYTKGIATITYNYSQIDLDEIIIIIKDLGYKVSEKHEEHMERPDSSKIVSTVMIIFAIYLILKSFGILNIFNYFPEAKAGMGYGLLFIIGLLTSIHCIAMCGGINLSQCVSHHTGRNISEIGVSNLRPSMLYNLGRVVSYTIIGGIVGAIGSIISFSGAAKGIVAIVAGIFMIIMGINMLNIFPWLRRFNPRMPKIFATKINEQKYKNNRPLYVGLLNGLMPCGPLQAMQLYALSTGDPLKGALSMLVFSLGTVPLMFGLGALSSILTKKFRDKMMTASAVLVVILGIFMFNNGTALSGISLPAFTNALSGGNIASTAVTAEIKDGVQVVNTKLSPRGYEPINVQTGIPVRWNIQADAEDINGCNNAIIIPEYNIEKQLQPGDNIIEFTPTESGAIPFSCWMGMIRSQISVYDDLSDMSQVFPSAENRLPSCCAL